MTESKFPSLRLDRRGLLVGMAAAGAAGPAFAQSTGGPVVETQHGKVRGYREGPVTIFKGVPYGDNTSGANRFMPPKPPKPWTGVRETVAFGEQAPQQLDRGVSVWSSWAQDQPQGENCLVLNIWTPAADGKKRPVMFWMHGGGYFSFSGASKAYQGERLVAKQDVVLVTVNHRLNVLGYMDLRSVGGDKYANSANLGQQDLVFALKWVRDNISNFGGDPRTVMIFGESGGGGKVSTTLAMPSAKGLFSRAAIQSGPGVRAQTPEAQAALTRGVLAKLNVTPATIDRLQQLPVADLIAAMNPRGGGFAPVLDPKTLPQHPFDPVANPLANDVPVLIGYNATEVTVLGATDPDFALTQAQLPARLNMSAPSASALMAAFKAEKPDADPSDVYFQVATERGMGVGSKTIAGRKFDQRRKAFLYKLTWETPKDGGKWRAPHSLDIPLIFDTIGASDSLIGAQGAPAAQKISAVMSQAWVNFARAGDPNGKGVPHWDPYDPDKRNTMIFDVTSRQVNDPLGDARRIWENA